MKSRRTAALALMIALVGLIGVSGCSSKKEDPQPAGAAPADNGPKPSEAKGDFPAMSVETFAKELSADPDAFAQKYKDKKVILSGTIVEKKGDPNQSGGIRLILLGVKGDKPINVRAELGMFDGYTVDQFPKVKAGDQAKVNAVVMFPKLKPVEGKPSEIELNMGTLVK